MICLQSLASLTSDFLEVYANSLLAVLNSRATLRAESQEGCSGTEMSTRFNIASAVANHRTSLIQVRSEWWRLQVIPNLSL